MFGLEPAQDAGPVQKVVHQRVDGDHAAADLGPESLFFGAPSRMHDKAMVRTLSETPYISRSGSMRAAAIRAAGQDQPAVCRLQLLVHPADQIAFGNIANEQEQRVGGLVQAAIAQVMGRQRTSADMIGLGTGPADLVVAAAVEMPVALELGATDAWARFWSMSAQVRWPVLLHIVVSDLIRDALVAQSSHQPIEHRRGFAVSDCCSTLVSCKVGPNLLDQGCGPGETTNAMDQPDRVVDGGRWSGILG